jgi:hypothetical protein
MSKFTVDVEDFEGMTDCCGAHSSYDQYKKIIANPIQYPCMFSGYIGIIEVEDVVRFHFLTECKEILCPKVFELTCEEFLDKYEYDPRLQQA